MSLVEESQRNAILELFKAGEQLTTLDIHNKTKIPKENIWQYINQFQNEDKIEAIDKKGRYNVYQFISQEEKDNLDDIRFLLDFFQEFKDTLLKNKKIIKFMSDNKDRFREISKKY